MMAAWPWQKLQARVQLLQETPTEKIPAVLFAAGHFSPTHLGHVLMMHQAEKRLLRLGYEVIGAFMSPSHDLSVLEDAKNRGAPELRSGFRIKLAELSTSQDGLVSVSSWEANQAKQLTDHEVAAALFEAVNSVYGDLFEDECIRVFCVCGCDHMARNHLSRGLGAENLGVVIVPRDLTEEILLERAASLVFVAEPAQGDAAALSSTKVREAILNGDNEYVKRAMPNSAARCVLQPTLRELQEMRIDFENLNVINPALDIIAQDGAWPLAKLSRRLAELDEGDGLRPAVVLVSGSMSPAHKGFFDVMKKATERLERAGYKVVGAFLSPQNATGAATEMRSAAGSEQETALSTGFRLKSTRLAASDNDFVSLGAWEASVVGRVPSPQEVMVQLMNAITDAFPRMRECLHIFYACGPGQAARRGLSSSLNMSDRGVVIVPCENEDCYLLEKPAHLFFIAEPRAGEANIVMSAKIRAAVQACNGSYVRSVCHPAVSRFILSPTEEEQATMKADFEYLLPAAASRITDSAVLAEAREKFKTVLSAWAGPPGMIAIEDVARVLEVLDPTWTNSELNTFTSGAFGAVGKAGKISSDDLVEWMFNK